MKKSVYDIVMERITKKIEETGTLPWQKPWVRNPKQNLFTGRPYNGINRFLLPDDRTPFWITYRQAKKAGLTFKSKEETKNSEIVVFYNIRTKEEIDEKTGEKEIKKNFILRYYRVYNSDQFEKDESLIKLIEKRKETGCKFENIKSADDIINSFTDKPKIVKLGNKARYVIKQDTIFIPDPEQFISSDHYYATLFHELVHSTGHEKRLKRKLNNFFGDKDYSKEELIAEIGSSFLAELAGVEKENNDAAYVKGWLNALKNDKRMLISASNKAEKAVEYITKLEG